MYNYVFRQTHRSNSIITTDRHTDTPPPQAVHPMGSRSRGCAGIWSPEPIKWSRWINSIRRARLCLGSRCRTTSTTTAPVAPPTDPPGRRLWAPGTAAPCPDVLRTGMLTWSGSCACCCSCTVSAGKNGKEKCRAFIFKIYEETQAYN